MLSDPILDGLDKLVMGRNVFPKRFRFQLHKETSTLSFRKYKPGANAIPTCLLPKNFLSLKAQGSLDLRPV